MGDVFAENVIMEPLEGMLSEVLINCIVYFDVILRCRTGDSS